MSNVYMTHSKVSRVLPDGTLTGDYLEVNSLGCWLSLSASYHKYNYQTSLEHGHSSLYISA